MLLPKYLNLVYAVGGGLAGAVGGGVGTHFLTSKAVEIFKPLSSEQRFVDFIREDKDFLTFDDTTKATKTNNKIEVKSKEQIKFSVEFKELEKDKQPTLNLDFDFSSVTTEGADKSKWFCELKAEKITHEFNDQKDNQIKNYWENLGLVEGSKPNFSYYSKLKLSSLLRRCINGKLKSFTETETKREVNFDDFIDKKTDPQKTQFSIIY